MTQIHSIFLNVILFQIIMTQKLTCNLREIEKSLKRVENKWESIDDKLDKLKIGRKDTPFDSNLRKRMMLAYESLNSILYQEIKPFSKESLPLMLELNNLVHYGDDFKLRLEYNKAIKATKDKFYNQIKIISKWYDKHEKKKSPSLKIASEIYVGIIGRPQVFIEGNHRTGSMISSWINMFYGYPPFILSPENAIAYFAPSSEIKSFSDRTTWRGRRKLPKYHKQFGKFWVEYVDKKYVK